MAVTLFAKNGGIDIEDGGERSICVVQRVSITLETLGDVKLLVDGQFGKAVLLTS